MITPSQCRAARGALALNVKQLSELSAGHAAAPLHRATISKFEASTDRHPAGAASTSATLKATLEAAGAVFRDGGVFVSAEGHAGIAERLAEVQGG